MILTPQQVKDAREWLLDCFTDDNSQERIRKVCHELIERAVSKHFEGGLPAFLATYDTANVF